MLDLPDHGYSDYSLIPIDPAGTVDAIMGGASTTIDRPGYRYAIEYTVGPLAASKEARIFQSLLEQGAREDVSYPWPLDFRSGPAGAPVVNGASPAGAVIPLEGLTPNYQFREGQPIAVISGGLGFVHRVTTPTTANSSGVVTLPVFPLTRQAFSDGDTVEVEKPRIRGILRWDGARQPAFGARPFTFTIVERR